MSHQPFEDWLFSDEPLDTQQEQTMQNHLDECERCQNLSHALDQVGEIFEFSTTPEPSPGFTQRWFERLNVAQEQRQIKRMDTCFEFFQHRIDYYNYRGPHEL